MDGERGTMARSVARGCCTVVWWSGSANSYATSVSWVLRQSRIIARGFGVVLRLLRGKKRLDSSTVNFKRYGHTVKCCASHARVREALAPS
jgi:hypothetical protein